jgi:hypothetical protein
MHDFFFFKPKALRRQEDCLLLLFACLLNNYLLFYCLLPTSYYEIASSQKAHRNDAPYLNCLLFLLPTADLMRLLVPPLKAKATRGRSYLAPSVARDLPWAKRNVVSDIASPFSALLTPFYFLYFSVSSKT